MGGKVDHEINQGKNPPIFCLNGQNYHRIGSLLPNDGKRPKFLQMYLSDPSEEISQRISAVRKESGKTLDDTLVRDLKDMLDTHNVHAKSFRMARDRFNESNSTTLKMRLIGKRKSEGRTYNTPTVSEVAALIEGDFHVNKAERDVVVQTKGGAFQFMTELNPSFLGLQYPLLFPYGQDGFREDVRLTSENDETEQGRKHVTQKEFFSYRVQDRKNESSYILRAKRLFQQFLVDGYTMIESSRLRYIRQHQKELRSDLYSGLADAVGRGETNASRVGQLIVLPNSFTGSARYMMQNYQDAMAICRWAGYPQLFITFTCNPKWPEIVRFVSDRGLNPEDRPDILCRIFKMKLDLLIKDLKHNKIFGDVKAVIYTIEFQKRGLPHAHIVLWVTQKGKRISPSEIDKIISAEIPDERSDPEYYNAVKELMMHGPCGPANKSAPCMDKNVCTKHFPKRFVEQTTIDEDGYPVYRRRNDGRRVTKGDVDLDNRHVVAHNRTLLLKYGAHINVEWCNQTRSVKYLFKYINKGDDRITVEFSEAVDNSKQQQVDEIKMYYDCRYISACEAAWRIFGYPIHYRDVPVERLNFHLPDEQPVYYHPDEPMESVVGKGTVQDTKFLAWMKANEKYPEARELTYVEFPTKFTWKQKTKEWVPRKRGFSIGRVYFVRPGAGEKFYLRTLLNVIKGATSFEELRTYNGTLFPSFRDACYARGLLKDDKEYIDGITEASHWASAYALRNLFVTLLLSDVLSKPQLVWEKCSQYFLKDILYNIRRNLNDPEYQLSTDEVNKYCLIEIEKLLRKRCRSLRDFVGMPMPPESDIPSIEDTIIHEELKYDKSVMAETHAKLLKNMNEEQRSVYDKIMESVDKTNGGVFFLYGHGGTGKTYVWKTLSAAIRSRGQIVLNVASSGIASLLLPGGRTAHSRFAIPINVTEDSTCNIKRGSPLAKLIQMAKLIIWDEAPMIHRHCFEALDRSMRDILSCSHDGNPKLPFGGKTIVFGGDFRQVLPVIPKGTRQDIVLASLNASHLWQYCTVLKLTKNMRLKNFTNETANPSILKLFADWILQIGDGVLGGSVDGEAEIDIPENFHVPVMSDPIESIVNATYPDFLKNMNNISYLEGRAILAPTIDEVDKVNDFMLLQNSSEEKTYFSSDSACSSTSDNELLQEIHSPEFLNGIKCSGVPSHELKLKVGVPVMLMRNIDHSAGLCNGTRLLVTKLGEHIIEAQMMSGTNAGEKFLIPRISLTPTDVRLPFTFMRRQFPLMVSYAMTMNKSQGQSLENVGVFLRRPVFTHGQLYVAVSRVTSPSGLKFVICDDEGNRKKTAKNVVYKEVFNNL
ncbi:unnamed protein product [Cuscuta epithymum]|uniref:ATP-dependent DNA helicase n=2 Tax=Cuscuta epithymum TaxID=186058 RepID=A0AAV0GE66_9ASTE|nr:unnamed protein product [Cuscuta epithymum]